MSRSSEQEHRVSISGEKQQQVQQEENGTTTSAEEKTLSNQQQQQASESLENQRNDSHLDDDNKPKRNPFCSRCRNHGKSAQVKGHKRHCEYRDCKCEGCQLVEVRQLVSAAQIKRRREQKQDEECGRKIEVSPPVLARELDRDPAALIAKTLIGSSAKHVQLHRSPSKQQLSSVIQQPNQHQYDGISHNGLPAQSALLPQTSTSHLSPATNPAALTNSVDLHQHHHHLSVKTSHLPSTSQNIQHHHPGHPQNHHQLHAQLSPQASLATNRTTTTIAASNAVPPQSAISNALQLFHFPNSVISAAAAAASFGSHPHQNHTSSLPLLSSAQFNHHSQIQHNQPQQQQPPTNHQVLLPSIREQINLVEEIHHLYGPMAIYAWLKAEKFDHHKVRDSIEISRASYNNLIDLKSKYRLENHFGNYQFTSSGLPTTIGNGLSGFASKQTLANGISSSNICSGVSSSSSSNSNSNCSSDNSNGSSSRSGSESNIDRDGNGNFISGSNNIHNNPTISHSHKESNNSSTDRIGADNNDPEVSTRNQNKSSSNSNCKSSLLTATTIASTATTIASTATRVPPITTNHGFTPESSAPPSLYTFGLSTNYSNIKNNSTDKNSSTLTTAAAHQHKTTASPATSHHHLPLANQLPMATAQNFLWPGFKMPTNAAGAPVLHPHFLPHFMQNPFGTAAAAAAAAAAAYHNQSAYTNSHQNHHLHQQVSPIDSSVTNSSPSAPSSSAVL